MTIILPAGSLATRILGTGRRFVGLLATNRIALFVAVAVAIGFGARLWLNAHDDRIFQDGRQRFADQIKAEYETKFRQRLEVVRAERAEAIAARNATEARLLQVTRLFDQAFARLDSISREMKERKIIYVERARNVPDSDLDATIVSVSDQIAGTGESVIPR